MKVIDLRTSPQEEKELAVSEANLLKTLKHDYLLSFTDSFERDGALCIVTEYCSNGDLSQYLEGRNKRKLETSLLKLWFKQISMALEYLHGNNIMHRDIKTPNIFLTESYDTRLGDMGLAKVLERPSAKAVTFCGSPYYMSPEIFSCKPYDFKSDIWALGVIVFELATLERPFDAMLMHQLVFKIVHGGLPKMPTDYPPELTELLTSILQKDPMMRPTAKDILKHAFFKDADDTPPSSIISPEEKAPSKKVIKKAVKQEADGGAAGDRKFNMDDLLDTLSMVREEDDKVYGAVGKGPKKDGPRKDLKGASPKKYDGKLEGVDNIMAETFKTTPKKRFDKTIKNITVRSVTPRHYDPNATMVSMSQVTMYIREPGSNQKEEFDTTIKAIQSQTASEAFNVMQMIVRTMTGLITGDEDEKKEIMNRTQNPETLMLRQIEHLQYYCTKVMGIDLFTAAHETLGLEKDDQTLEARLKNLIGPDYFEKCGVQLMFLKNYEYNFEKLHTGN